MQTRPAVSVVRAGEADANLARQAIVEVHERSCDEGALAECLRDPDRYLLVAVDGERAVGSLNGFALRHPHRPEPAFLLYEIDVRPEYRNRGVGQALVARFVAEARAAGAFEVWVVAEQSNAPAIAMYTRAGFQVETRDDLVMVHDLEANR